MGTLDINQRKVAVPFLGHIWGQNQSDLTAIDLASGNMGDAVSTINAGGIQGQITCTLTNNSSTTIYTLPAGELFVDNNGVQWTLQSSITLATLTYYTYQYLTAVNYASFVTPTSLAFVSDPTGGNVTISTVASASIGANPTNLFALRILQPHYGQLIECKLDINMSFASADNGIGFYAAIGTFASMAQTYIQNLSYTQSQLDQSWAKINGHTAHIPVTSGSINAKGINLLPALYKYGDANYFEDAFVLLLCFDKTPTPANFIINWLNIHQSTTGIA